mgnify:CR=1 FL=1
MADIDALDLTQLTSLDGSEQFVMFNTTEGKRATVHTVKDYIESQLTFPNAHGTGLYGAKWDRLTNLLTRTRDAVGITTTTTNFCHKGTINANYDNPFDSIYPWSEMKVVNIDLTKYRNGYSLTDCIVAVYGDPDFTYFGSENLFVGRYRPEYWYRSEEDSNGAIEFLVSQNERVGFMKSEECVDGISFCVDVGSSKVSAGAGIPLTNITVATIHSRANSSGFTLQDIYSYDSALILYLVEYANMNSQSAIGSGCSDLYRQNASDLITNVSVGTDSTTFKITGLPSTHMYVGEQLSFGASSGATTYKGIVTGFTLDGTTYTVTLDRALALSEGMYLSVHGMASCEFPYIGNSLGSASGYLGTDTKANAYYRGCVMWGNRYAYILGIYRQTGTNHIWLCPTTLDPDDALDTSVHTDSGKALPTLSAAAWQTVGGNAKRIGGLAAFMITDTSSGTSATPVGDQQYVPLASAGNTILLRGGNSSNGWYVGAFCGYWLSGSGGSTWCYASSPHSSHNVSGQ